MRFREKDIPIISKEFPNRILKISALSSAGGFINILFNNKELKQLNYDLNEIAKTDDIDDITGYLLNKLGHWNYYCLTNHELILFDYNIEKYGKLINNISYLYLTDHGLYYTDFNTGELILTNISNVKNICGDFSYQYCILNE